MQSKFPIYYFLKQIVGTQNLEAKLFLYPLTSPIKEEYRKVLQTHSTIAIYICRRV